MEYDDQFVRGLEYLWGPGMLSPGGAEELREMLKDTETRGRKILDIGSGLGGFDRLLVNEHGAGHVTAIDIESYVVERAQSEARSAGLSDRIEYRLVEPGSLEFDDALFDIVFTKDSIAHVEDKLSVYREIFRVLKPGGEFVGSDWLGGETTSRSELVHRWLEFSGLGLIFCTAAEMEQLLIQAGFVSISTRDRNPWFQDAVRNEIAKVSGEQRKEFARVFGEDTADYRYESSTLKLKVAAAGELCPTHFRARKPTRSNP